MPSFFAPQVSCWLGGVGVLVVRDAIVRRAAPTPPGGGTVSFVSPWGHVCSSSLCECEEGGTPHFIGDISVALAMIVTQAMGQDVITASGRVLRDRALAVWHSNLGVQMMVSDAPADSLPILSLRIRDRQGGLIHRQLFTRMFSQIFGVQARGGCACVGSYAHRFLAIERAQSDDLFKRIVQGTRPSRVECGLIFRCCWTEPKRTGSSTRSTI